MRVTFKNYRRFTDENPASIDVITGFAALTGPNNAGKSSLLRWVFEYRPFLSSLSRSPFYFFGDFDLLNAAVELAGLRERTAPFTRANDRPLTISFALNDPGSDELTSIEFEFHRDGRTGFGKLMKDGKEIAIRSGWTDAQNHVVTTNTNSALNLHRYIVFWESLANSIYLGPIRHADGGSGSGISYDLTVGDAFVSTWRNLKTGEDARLSERASHITDDIRRLFGFDQFEINPANNGHTLSLLINGRSFHLTEVGAGLMQFILTYATVGAKQPPFLFIDEPEGHLHPRLQVDFLLGLAAYVSEGVIFSTHSIGLSRAIAQRIYFAYQTDSERSRIEPFGSRPGSLIEQLGEMSFGASLDMRGNRILLVEGSTDIILFQQFLRLWQKDHRYVVLSLGGSDMIKRDSHAELQELLRITQDVDVVIDSERSDADELIDPIRLDFQRTCRALGIRCHILDRRATDNYLTEAATWAEQGFRGLTPFERAKDHPNGWDKSVSWRIARRMTRADLSDTDLGRFLESLP